MTNSQAAAAAFAEASQALRCPQCDVMWRGTADVACWCCGATGTPRGDIRLVREDDD